MRALEGKVAIVTGSGSGIGEKIAHVLAERGAKVIVCATTEAGASRVAAAIRDEGNQAAPAFGDLSDPATAEVIVKAAIANFGRLDVLVNNAALTSGAVMARDTNITGMDPEIWARSLAVNVIGPALLCKSAIPEMVKNGGGSIVNISSGRGVQGDLGLPAYGASKAALMNLSLNVATQYGKHGIRSNTVIVGMVLTPPVKAALSEEMIELYLGHHLTPYIGELEDVAEPVAFLASDASRFITGAALSCDGGMTSHAAPFADVMKISAAGMLKTD